MSGPGEVADPVLSARAAQLLYAYARAVDDGDLATLAVLAADDIAITRVDGTHHGRDRFLAVYQAFRDSAVQVSQHAVSNVRAYPQEGGQVRASAYFQATVIDAAGARMIVGRYDDTMRADGDGPLRFVHKRILVDCVVPLAAPGDWAALAPGPA